MNYISNTDFWKTINDYYRYKHLPYTSNAYRGVTRLQWTSLENDKKVKAQDVKTTMSGYIGQYFKCNISIQDITQDTILGLETSVIEENLIEHNLYEYNHLLHFKYDESFRDKLLNFNKGYNSVKIEGRFISIQEGEPAIITLQLTSIEKGCFIATTCYESFDAPQVLLLRRYRDETLLKTLVGRTFVTLYYSISPHLANLISKSRTLKKIVKNLFLEPIIFYLNKQFKSYRQSKQ